MVSAQSPHKGMKPPLTDQTKVFVLQWTQTKPVFDFFVYISLHTHISINLIE